MKSKVVASTVVRGAKRGEAHGALYIVDLHSNKVQQMLDWKADIGWEGRGGERGLRGVAVVGEQVYVAGSDELFAFTPKFQRVGSFGNAYLKNCHEIYFFEGLLFLASTGFDSILVFDPASRNFLSGLNIVRESSGFRAVIFDPNRTGGPAPSTTVHLNSIIVDDSGIYVAGRNLNMLLRIHDNQVKSVARLPLNTNNARPFSRGLLFNDTAKDQFCWVNGSNVVTFDVPRFDAKKLTHTDMKNPAIARQAFARGLCPLSDTVVAAGSSPATISIYDLAKRERVKSVNLTMNVRAAVHGLAVWPF